MQALSSGKILGNGLPGVPGTFDPHVDSDNNIAKIVDLVPPEGKSVLTKHSLNAILYSTSDKLDLISFWPPNTKGAFPCPPGQWRGASAS